MAIQQPATIDLADIGVAVPPGTTIVIVSVPEGLEVRRRDERFIVEHDDFGCWTLTGVVGRDELPAVVPRWLEVALEKQCGIAEVRLGR